MKIVVISDTHGKHCKLKHLPKADVIIHAGDISNRGEISEIEDFIDWYSKLPYKHKILIAGNHDRYLEKISKTATEDILFRNITYLNDSGIDINGVKIWGSPIQPTYNDWAFNKDRGRKIRAHWKLIPTNVDILITHGPSFGKLDKTVKEINVGCKDLSKRIKQIKPQYHIFGHVHECHGTLIDEMGVIYINASLVDIQKNIHHKPITFEIHENVNLVHTKNLIHRLLSRVSDNTKNTLLYRFVNTFSIYNSK